jgi:hypothetical protein
MRRLLSRHRVAIFITILYLLSACGFFIARGTISDLEREIDRSTRTDCELDNRANENLVSFAGELARVIQAGTDDEAAARLAAELYASTERLFPVTPCP